MKRIIFSACSLIAIFSLTSCLSYNNTNFSPSAYPGFLNQKVYLEKIVLNSNASQWITNTKKIQSNSSIDASVNDEDLKQIAEYLSQQHPTIFSNNKEGAVPIKLEINGHNINFGSKIESAILSCLTLTIIPVRIFNTQDLFIYAVTMEDPHPKVGLHMCTMNVMHSSGLCFFPFVWIGYSNAYTKTINKHFMYGADDIWRNHFLTPAFADNAAMAVVELMKKTK